MGLVTRKGRKVSIAVQEGGDQKGKDTPSSSVLRGGRVSYAIAMEGVTSLRLRKNTKKYILETRGEEGVRWGGRLKPGREKNWLLREKNASPS